MLAVTLRASRDIALRSPPIGEAERAIGVLGHALGKWKSEADRSESAIGVLKKCPKTLAGPPQTSRDIALRSPPIREAQSAIGVFRNALGMCKRGAREEEEVATEASVKTRNYQCAIDSFLIGLNDLRGDCRKRGPNLKGGLEINQKYTKNHKIFEKIHKKYIYIYK